MMGGGRGGGCQASKEARHLWLGLSGVSARPRVKRASVGNGRGKLRLSAGPGPRKSLNNKSTSNDPIRSSLQIAITCIQGPSGSQGPVL